MSIQYSPHFWCSPPVSIMQTLRRYVSPDIQIFAQTRWISIELKTTPELSTISPEKLSSIRENSQSKLRKTWLSFLSVFVILTQRGKHFPKRKFFIYKLCKWIILTYYFLPWFPTIMKIFEPESGLHELNVLQS